MWEDYYEGKSLLTPASASKLCLSISDVITNWLKSLPKEIIPNILIRLPIKSLIKFTSVSKSWNSTIKNPTFIRTHLTHLTHTLNSNDQNTPHLLLLHAVHSEGTSKPFGRVHISGFQEDPYSLHYDSNDVTEYCKVEFPIALKEELVNPCFRVVGTCDGLFLLADDLGRYGYTFVMWNPSVRKYLTLPKPSVRFSTHGGYDASVGLGYDAVGKDYKVVRLTTLLDHPGDEHPATLAQVYSLATGSWGLVRVLPRCAVPGSWVQAFVNGALHWLALRWMGDHFVYFVVAFDVGSESYREVMLPKRFKTEKSVELRLCASGDMKSIALFVRCKSESDCFLDIWVMKEYCIEKSWTKLMILTPQGPKRSLLEPLCFRRIGEVVLVLEDDRELVSLDIGSKQFKSLGISGGQVCSVDFFEESLVLLDRKDAVSY